ncbi:MAG: 30S ribosomal protein S17 [bacterium]|nr:30S ribosomal protein S17 [bacterium]
MEKKKRTLIGIVVSDKMAKTRVISITRMKQHSKYLKYYKVTQRFKAHDEENVYHTGDTVVIEETRPMSKDKRWIIKEKVTSGKRPSEERGSTEDSESNVKQETSS